MLEGFQRIALSPGESKEVNFSLGFNELSIINTKSQRVIEPSDYTVFIGGDSEASQSAKFAIIQ
jgi:beta-glucosidase